MSESCPLCQTPLFHGQKFCIECGAPCDRDLGPLTERLRLAIRHEVDAVLRDRYRDQRYLELETADRVASRVATWGKWALGVAGVPLVIGSIALGLVGLRTSMSLRDASVVAARDVVPAVQQAREDVAGIRRETAQLERRLASIGVLVDSTTLSKRAIGAMTPAAPRGAAGFATPPGTRTVARVAPKPGRPVTPSGVWPALAPYDIYLQAAGFDPRHDRLARDRFDFASWRGALSPQVAADSSLLRREYALYVCRVISRIPPSPRIDTAGIERHALLSGLATYLTCSFEGSARFGEEAAVAYERVTSPTGQAFRHWDLRAVRKFDDLRPGLSSAFGEGTEVWGGLLWELRSSVGSALTDRLALRAWAELAKTDDAQPLARRYAEALVRADRALAGGAHADAIETAFARRGAQIDVAALGRASGTRR